jgi:hypothetical protein
MKQDSEKKESLLMQFISVKKSEVNLKFLFDHIRNYLICGTILASGLYVIRNGTVLIPFEWAKWIEGGLLIAIFILLMALNLAQGSYAAKLLRAPPILYYMSIILLLASAHELIWILIGQRS